MSHSVLPCLFNQNRYELCYLFSSTKEYSSYFCLNTCPVKGKWVILLNGIPPADENYPAFPDSLRKLYSDWKTHDSLKLAALTRHKAAGLIVLPDKYATENWERTVLYNYRYNYIHYAEDDINKNVESEPVLPVILVHPELAQILFTGQNYNPVTNKGNYHPYILSGYK